MTTVTTPLIERLNNESKEVQAAIAEAVLTCGLAVLPIQNKVTHFEYGRAAEAFLDAFDGKSGLPEAFVENERPTSDLASDARPLYQRLDDENEVIGHSIRKSLAKLQIASLMITDVDVYNEYIDALQAFEGALGLPSRDELATNPDAFPKVATNPISDMIAKANAEADAELPVSDDEHGTTDH